jgi:hypothetical protein
LRPSDDATSEPWRAPFLRPSAPSAAGFEGSGRRVSVVTEVVTNGPDSIQSTGPPCRLVSEAGHVHDAFRVGVWITRDRSRLCGCDQGRSTCAGVALGWVEMYRAAAPATSGVAKLVPEPNAYPPFREVDARHTLGAARYVIRAPAALISGSCDLLRPSARRRRGGSPSLPGSCRSRPSRNCRTRSRSCHRP